MFRKVDITKRFPEMGKWVTTIDEAGEHIVYQLTEHGWHMRDVSGDKSPNNNLPIRYWLEEIKMGSQAILGNAIEVHEKIKEHDLDWNSFSEGWIQGRMRLVFEQ